MKKGFTLIEMLIVIAVIAILVGIALPRLRGMREEGNYAKANGELKTLQAALESYFIHYKAYPVQITTPDAEWQDDDAGSLTKAVPKLISTPLKDPFTPGGATEYRYATSASVNSDYYVIFSVGFDGIPDITGIGADGLLNGTDDDDIFVTNGDGLFVLP
ncbi:MAG: type II secretion system protein [Candidatus Omnitrophota bacterium]|nr:MAG: type II secretion system protein [Candidatus Omnitrophota bacterium]